MEEVTGVKDKIFAYLQLMRFANVFTAMADVLAGYLIVFGAQIRFRDLLALLLSSSCVYAGGCVLNDLRDREIDARERPFRPLPSGRVSAREALWLLFILFGGGLLASYPVGASSALVTAFLIVLVVSYNMLAKHMDVAGPLNMGACRALNLILGASPGILLMGHGWPFPFISLAYVFSLTVLSRFEVSGAPANKRWIVLVGWTGVVALLAGMVAAGGLSQEAVAYVCVFAALTGLPLAKGLFDPKAVLVRKAVKALILGIPLLDAVYVSGAQGWELGVPVALCIVPAVFVSRYLYVT